MAISEGPQVEHVEGGKEVVEFRRNLPGKGREKVSWQESVEPLPAFRPWFDQFEATLVHSNVGFPVPETGEDPHLEAHLKEASSGWPRNMVRSSAV